MFSRVLSSATPRRGRPDLKPHRWPTISAPPVYDRFTDGFDTADLKDAKALLEELK